MYMVETETTAVRTNDFVCKTGMTWLKINNKVKLITSIIWTLVVSFCYCS